MGRLHGHLVADVGEVGDGQHVHHAPGVVGRIAHQLAAYGAAYTAARAVAADHVAGFDGFDLAAVSGIGALHLHGDGVVGCAAVHLQIHKVTGVVRLQPGGGVAHVLQVEVVHPRLVQHHVRKLGQAVFGVLHPAMAHDAALGLAVGLPEGDFVDPAGFFEHAVGEVEGLEHLHGAAGNAVGLAQLQGAVFLVHDAGADAGKRGQLGG